MYLYLIDKLSTDLKVPKCTLKVILGKFRDEMISCICEHGYLAIPKLGSYTVKQTVKQYRLYGRLIKPHFYIKFIPSNEMKRQIKAKSRKELNYEAKKYEGECRV